MHKLAEPAGKALLDYLRNRRGTTAIGTYLPRARPSFPIAAPVTWRELARGIRPDAFTMNKPPSFTAAGALAMVPTDRIAFEQFLSRISDLDQQTDQCLHPGKPDLWP